MMGRRARSWVLIVSLTLNLFLVGLIAGHRLSPPPPPESIPGTVFADLRRMSEALPPETRGEIRDHFEAHRPDMIRGLMAMRAARHDVRDVLQREPYDPEALRAAFDTLRDRTDAVQAIVHTALIEIAGQLDPDERLAIARPPERRGGPDRQGSFDRPGPSDRPGRPGMPLEPDPESPPQ